MEDLENLLNKGYTDALLHNLSALPHPTIQKFGLINIAIVGASRRFLAQITRHQNEVKFMSGSLQYSDYSSKAQFVVPYEMLNKSGEFTVHNPVVAGEMAKVNLACIDAYLGHCKRSLQAYEELAKVIGRDAAGYAMPQGMRNILIISATPYQWKHMISQRVCRRNTLETRYVMLRCWEELQNISALFDNCGAACMSDTCPEGAMCCGAPILEGDSTDILDADFKLLRQ